MRRIACLAVTLLAVFPPATAAEAKKELVIAISPFPSTFNPLIDSMLPKPYVPGNSSGHN